MARRSILVAIVAAAAALVPVSAQAATPAFTIGYVPFSSPVTLQWTPTGTLTEQLFRVTGACPQTGGTRRPTHPETVSTVITFRTILRWAQPVRA